jgi:hypothetical protein
VRYAGAEWLRSALAHRRGGAQHLSDFGAVVADIAGAAFAGLYHLEAEVLRASWSDDERVELTIGTELATWDGSYPNALTALVVLCHDACVRLQIEGAGQRRLRLVFHKSRGRAGRAWECHPEIEDAVDLVRRNQLDARELVPQAWRS